MARLGRSFPLNKRFLPALGPIFFDTSASSGYQALSNSYTYGITIGSQSNRALFVSVGFFNATASVSSITLGGQSLTLDSSKNSGTTLVRNEVWKLVAPASGAGTITVNLSGSVASASGAIAYYGVDQTTPVDARAGATGSGNNATVSVTTVTDGAWVLDAIVSPTTSGTLVPAAAERQRTYNTGAVGEGGNADLGVYPVGTAVSMSWSNVAVSTEWVMQAIAIRPFTTSVVVAVYQSVLTMLGVG